MPIPHLWLQSSGIILSLTFRGYIQSKAGRHFVTVMSQTTLEDLRASCTYTIVWGEFFGAEMKEDEFSWVDPLAAFTVRPEEERFLTSDWYPSR